jgi:HD superfamily phosphohydrolase
LWEGVVHQGSDKSWTHEVQSQQIIEHMIKVNDIKLHESPEQHDYALRLITSLITGDSEAWAELLRPEEFFITEIVSNKHCCIDVDKCDYILRDQYHVGDQVILKQFAPFLDRARVVFDADGTSHIGYHVNDFQLIENLFYNRAYLHMNVYQNQHVAACEKMVKDICVKAAVGGVKIAGLSLTEVHQDQSAFSLLDDSVLEVIKASKLDNPLVKEAQNILRDLNEGRHYQLVWESSDEDKTIFNSLVKKFGDIFCIVGRKIPSAEVPTNIPMYNDDEKIVPMTSSLRLSFESWMIFCTKSEEFKNAKNYIDSLNNNNI